MQETRVRPVTRIEIGEGIAEAFADGGATHAELIAAARAAGAREELLAVLDGLTRSSYTELRQLWLELPHVPVRDA